MLIVVGLAAAVLWNLYQGLLLSQMLHPYTVAFESI